MLYQNKRIKFSSKLFCKTYTSKITNETVYLLLWRKDYVDFMRKKNGYIVYKITCIVTGLSYYGYTYLTVQQRWNGHCRGDVTLNNKFFNAINEYGKENWTLEVLEMFDTAFFAKAYEIYCIDKFDSIKNGYNSTEGGDGTYGLQPMLGKEFTIEHCQNISKGLKDVPRGPISQEHKNKISQTMSGVPKSIETCQKISKAKQGVPRPLEVRQKMSDTKKAKSTLIIDLNKQFKKDGKVVIQYDLDMKELNRYKSIMEASARTGENRTNISRCCNGIYKLKTKYIWKFAIDENKQ
jgi:group I intron endonuclease